MTINPETAGIEVSFDAAADRKAALEGALALLNNANDSENRLIVVLDEFEEIAHLEPGTDELLCGVNHTARKFVGLMYIDRTPDETTILHFRHFLEKHDFGRKIFELNNERFNKAGLTLCKGRIIDTIQRDAVIAPDNNDHLVVWPCGVCFESVETDFSEKPLIELRAHAIWNGSTHAADAGFHSFADSSGMQTLAQATVHQSLP